ncbi:MAG: Gfo/Idh/MocA family oxidoreductase [Streptococcaceae bacterium]|jgi:predicted dehydrogenase|nr:Gfo/Idh/MocA family oxidoreductase [Streptococcaceae bacterium]
MKKLNIAYVGFGKSTNRYHIPFVKTRENIAIKRVFVPSLDERAEERVALEAAGTEFTTDLSVIKNDPEIDLVVIVTPAPFHYAYAKELLEAGKNVLTDKPATSTLAEAEELVALANDNGLFYMPFQNRRFDSDFLTVKKVLETGYLGELTDIVVNMDHFRPDDAATVGVYDGAWYGHGVHLVDQMISLFGKPQSVAYDIRSVRKAGAADDYFNVSLRYEKFSATVAASETAALPHPKWSVYGTRGTFVKQEVDQQENDLKVGIMPGADGFGRDTAADFGELTYYNSNGDRIVKHIASEVGDYARVYDAAYAAIIDGAEKLVTDAQLLAVIETLENGVK